MIEPERHDTIYRSFEREASCAATFNRELFFAVDEIYLIGLAMVLLYAFCGAGPLLTVLYSLHWLLFAGL